MQILETIEQYHSMQSQLTSEGIERVQKEQYKSNRKRNGSNNSGMCLILLIWLLGILLNSALLPRQFLAPRWQVLFAAQPIFQLARFRS